MSFRTSSIIGKRSQPNGLHVEEVSKSSIFKPQSLVNRFNFQENIIKEEEKNDDVVSLMTIHAAKGLEFRSVHVVGLEGKTLKVHYQGACGSCPSSLTATLSGIEGLVRTVDPELEVIPV